MRIKFKYNEKIYSPVHPENKLKKLGITWNDVEIIENQTKEQPIEMMNNRLYHFKNSKNGYNISSIYSNLDHLRNIVKDLHDYEFIKMTGNDL